MVCGFKEMTGHELWATTSEGIYRFADSVWIPVNLNTGYDITPCTQVIPTPEGIYINYGDKLILKKKGSSIVLGKNPRGPDDSYFHDLLQINHRIFINSTNCLYEVVNQKLRVLIDSIPA